MISKNMRVRIKRKLFQVIHELRGKKRGRYYVIYRKAGFVGIGSLILSNLSCIKYAIDNGMIPVIDMQYFNNIYLEHDEFCKKNAWDFYFDTNKLANQKLEDIYKWGNYTLGTGYPQVDCPNDSMDFLLDAQKKTYWNMLFERYMPLNKYVLDFAEKEYFKKILPNIHGEKIAGILLRGTDYIALRPAEHPVQPEVEYSIMTIRNLMSQWGFSRFLLVTEDTNIFDKVSNAFPEQVIDLGYYAYAKK